MFIRLFDRSFRTKIRTELEHFQRTPKSRVTEHFAKPNLHRIEIVYLCTQQ